MTIPRNLGAFADNLNSSGKLNVGGINATGTPSSTTALLGDGSWGTVTTSPAGSTGQVQYNNGGAFGAISSGTSGQVLTSAGSGAAPVWSAPSSGGYTLSTPQNVSGNSVTFTGIPSGVKSVIIQFKNLWVSLYGIYIQIGTSGGINTTSYQSVSLRHVPGASHSSFSTSTESFYMYVNDSSAGMTGTYELTLQDSSNYNWIGNGQFSAINSNSGVISGNGYLNSLGGELTQVRIKAASGQTLDAGTINIMYL